MSNPPDAPAALVARLRPYLRHKDDCELVKPSGVLAGGNVWRFWTVAHVCNLMGYNPMIDPPCPGCSQTPVERALQCTCGLTELEAALAALGVPREPIATREDVKDVYAEGLATGMELGRALAAGTRVLDGVEDDDPLHTGDDELLDAISAAMGHLEAVQDDAQATRDDFREAVEYALSDLQAADSGRQGGHSNGHGTGTLLDTQGDHDSPQRHSRGN